LYIKDKPVTEDLESIAMKVIAVCLLFPTLLLAATSPPGVNLVSCDRSGAVIEVNLPEFKIQSRNLPEGTFSELIVPGWHHLTEAGKPALPSCGIWLAVPPEAEVSFTVENITTRPISLVNPLPSPTLSTDPYGRNPEEHHYADRVQYASTLPYPAQWVSLGKHAMMRTFQVVPIRIFPVQVQIARGEALVAQKLRIRITFKGGRRGGFVSDPYGEALSKKTIINYNQARGWQEKPSGAKPDAAENYGQYKILVKHDGLYTITYSDLIEAGITPDFDPQTLKIYLAGEQLPIRVEGEWDGEFNADDYILFYGIFPRGTYTHKNIYTDTNVYWLDWGGVPGLRVGERSAAPGNADLATEFKAHTWAEFDVIYEKFGAAPLDDDIDHWVWLKLDVTYNPQFSYLLDLPGLVLVQGQSYGLSVSLRGYTYNKYVYNDHQVLVTWNGYPAINSIFSQQEQFIATTGVPWDTIRTQQPNELIFYAEAVTGVDPNAFFLDWFKVDYWRDYSVINDTLLFENPQNMQSGLIKYELTGLQDTTVELWNLTRMERLVDFDYNSGSLAFQDSALDTTYYFVAGQGSWLTPEIIPESPSNLKSPNHEADYLIITHEDFYSSIQPLSNHYQGMGYEVLTAQISDVYDEFSYGLKTPQAIFDFIQYAYLNYQGNIPAFVLLVGDASWDYKDNDTLSYIDYVPTHSFMSYKWGETSSDNWFTSVSDTTNPLPDCFIGRFPVNTPEETEILVNKTISYGSAPPGYWRSQVIVSNGANIDTVDGVVFDSIAQNLIDSYFPEWYEPNRVYSNPSAGYEQYQGSSVRLIDYIDQGAAMINYIGHAGNQMWETLDQSEISLLNNGSRLPFVTAFSCFTGIFSNTHGFGEEFILKETGGAIAYWSNTALGFQNNNALINDCIFKTFFERDSLQFGAAAAGAKWIYYSTAGNTGDVVDIFTLLGDPAAAFIFEDPVPEDTLDSEPPVIEIDLGSNFSSGEFIDNPVQITCTVSDNKEIITSENQLIFSLTQLTDALGYPIPVPNGEWDLDWSSELLDPPDSTGGHEIQVVFSDSLPAGEWRFLASAQDYLNNLSEDSVFFMIKLGELVLDNPLYYNHPGCDETSFTFSLSREAVITIKVFTVAGRLIWTDTYQGQVGYNDDILWDGHDQQGDRLSNGAYLYKIIARSGQEQVERLEKMIKIR